MIITDGGVEQRALSEMWLHFQSLPSRPLFDPINRYMHPHLGPFYAPRRAAYQHEVIAVPPDSVQCPKGVRVCWFINILRVKQKQIRYPRQCTQARVSDYGACNHLYGQLREDRDKFLISVLWRYLNFPSYF